MGYCEAEHRQAEREAKNTAKAKRGQDTENTKKKTPSHLEGQDTTLGLSLIANIGILLAHADHDTLVTRAADDRGEHGAGRIITGETGLAHTGAVVNNQGLDLTAATTSCCFVRHV